VGRSTAQPPHPNVRRLHACRRQGGVVEERAAMAEGSIGGGDGGTWWRRRVQPAAPAEAVVEQGSGGEGTGGEGLGFGGKERTFICRASWAGWASWAMGHRASPSCSVGPAYFVSCWANTMG
jgi:hypothetical protein